MNESDLDAALSKIIEEKHYYKATNESWSVILVGMVEKISKIARKTDKLDIHSKCDKVISHLTENFKESPPFSVVRLAEVVRDPQAEGYDVSTEVGIAKFMNGLIRISFVSSTIDDFPAPTFRDVPQQSDGIPLVKIPWLSDIKKREKDDVEESEKKRVKSDEMDMSLDSISPERAESEEIELKLED